MAGTIRKPFPVIFSTEKGFRILEKILMLYLGGSIVNIILYPIASTIFL